MKKIYISGPISGTDDYIRRFEVAEEYLRGKGYDVVNPVELTKLMSVETTKWSEYMQVALDGLLMCQEIYMLDGWERSKGAQIEKLFAEGCGMKILYQVP